MKLDSRHQAPGALPRADSVVKAPKLTPAWRADPPGPLSSDAVPERYTLPPADHSPRPELALGIVLGGAVAAPFIVLSLPLWGFFVSFGTLFAGSRIYSSYKIRRWRHALATAFDRLETGDVDSAESACRDIALAQRHPLLRIASADFGYFALRRGDLRTALAIYSNAWESSVLPLQLRPNVAANMALCYAVMGEVEAAERWLPHESQLITPAGAAVVRSRQKQYDAVLALRMPATRPWQEPFIRHERRLLQLMQAFARRMSSAPSPGDVPASAYDSEWDYLTPHWPELRSFLAQGAGA